MAHASEASAQGTLHYFGFPATAAQIAVARHDPGARLKRGLLALGACWGLAALTVLVPIAHFVLVPGFFLLGIWLLVKRLGEDATIVSVEGDCPKCGERRTFLASGRLKTRSKVQCPVCRNELELTVESSAPSATAP
jgi:hypothetical protein